jgi:hypothetical protein
MCKVVFGLAIFLGVSNNVCSQKTIVIALDTLSPISIKTIPAQHYVQTMPFFCQKERLLQQKTGLNIYLRLGTKEYVDYLEQKPNARRQF